MYVKMNNPSSRALLFPELAPSLCDDPLSDLQLTPFERSAVQVSRRLSDLLRSAARMVDRAAAPVPVLETMAILALMLALVTRH